MRHTLFLLLLASFPLLSCDMEESFSPIPQQKADSDLVPALSQSISSKHLSISSDISEIHSDSKIYDRERAIAYAKRYAESPNTKISYCQSSWTGMPADCTNFISQALWYGGLSMAYNGNADEGWWYSGSCDDSGSSKSWRQVNGLMYWLTVESDLGKFTRLSNAKIGDLVFYKFPNARGVCSQDFTYDHATMITGFGKHTGVPLVSYHTNDVQDIPWNWSLREDGIPGLGDACSYVVIHIKD